MTANYYDTAQICVKGHVVNTKSVSSPMQNKRFCDQCSSGTVTTCQRCSAFIRGAFHGENASSAVNYSPPAFCHNCGAPFPWKK